MQDAADWLVGEVVVDIVKDQAGMKAAKLKIRFTGNASKMLKASARRGFKGLSLSGLKRLATDLGIAASIPSRLMTEIPLVTHLVKHCLGELATDKLVMEALVARHEVSEVATQALKQHTTRSVSCPGELTGPGYSKHTPSLGCAVYLCAS